MEVDSTQTSHVCHEASTCITEMMGLNPEPTKSTVRTPDTTPFQTYNPHFLLGHHKFLFHPFSFPKIVSSTNNLISINTIIIGKICLHFK